MYLNENKETYYNAYNGCKSTVDLTLANLIIAPEYKWNKEYKLGGNDHFSIVIEQERDVKKNTITINVQNQNTIKEAHSCLVKTILQAAEKTIPKTSPETKKRLPIAWWDAECKRE